MKRNEFYPEDWSIIAREIKEAVGYVCQECGRQCRRPGELWLGWEYTLTIAHLDQCYDEPVVTVAALCIRCHFQLDAPHSWQARRRHDYIRRRIAGQLGLLLDAKMIA